MSYSDKIHSTALQIEQSVLEGIIRHGEESYPFECCGFLFGKDGETRKISHARRVENSKEGDQRRRFEISPKDYMQAESYALTNDLDLVGIYHSHPDHPALPSQTDLDKALPYFSYIITSVNEGKATNTTSWQLGEDGLFDQEEIINNRNSN